MIHQTTILGALGKDAEVRKAGEQFVISFPIASTLHWKSGNENKEKTFWTECDQWFQKEESAKKLAEWLRKGSKVIVVGQSYASAYLNKESKVVASLCLRVEKLEIVNSTKERTQASTSTAPPTQIFEEDPDDGLPF